MLSKLLFWASLIFIFYTYAGYPVLLFLWSKISPKRINKSLVTDLPRVSVVVCAKNEEKSIAKRVENLINQDYPKDKLEIIIVSDGSTDQTNRIVQNYETPPGRYPTVRLLDLPASKGKPTALNKGIKSANSEIIVFADARQKFKADAIKELAYNFNDPSIGCVSGELFLVSDSNSTIKVEMGLYWKIEKLVRKLESSIKSVAGATGAIYAIRKSLYKELPPETLLDDVLTPMNIVIQRYRTILDNKACAYDNISHDAAQEWRRKVRTLAGNWQLINLMPKLLFPWSNPIWWRFLSHKIFRLIIPFCLPVLLISAIMIHKGSYQAFAGLQIIFYLMAVTGWLVPAARRYRVINLSFFFMVLNLAAINGFWYWLSGNCEKAWLSI